MSKIRIIKDIKHIRNESEKEFDKKNNTIDIYNENEYKRDSSIILKIPKLRLHSSNKLKKDLNKEVNHIRNRSANKISLIISPKKVKNKNKNKIPLAIKKNKVNHIEKDDLIIQIKNLWNKLGVTHKFQEIFKNYIVRLPINKTEEFYKYELNHLKDIDNTLKKIINDITSREKIIDFLKRFENYDKGKKNIREEQLIENLSKILNELKTISISIINNFNKIRRESSYEVLKMKFDFEKIQGFKKDYLLKIKYDTDFIYNSSLCQYFNFDCECLPFISFNLNDNYIDKVSISKSNIESVNEYQYILFNELIFYEMNKINNHNYTLSSPNSIISIESSKRIHLYGTYLNINHQNNNLILTKEYTIKPIKLNIGAINNKKRKGFNKKPNPISLITNRTFVNDDKNRSPLIQRNNHKRKTKKITKSKSEIFCNFKTENNNNKNVIGIEKNDLEMIDNIISRSILLNQKYENNNNQNSSNNLNHIHLNNNSSNFSEIEQEKKKIEKKKEKKKGEIKIEREKNEYKKTNLFQKIIKEEKEKEINNKNKDTKFQIIINTNELFQKKNDEEKVSNSVISINKLEDHLLNRQSEIEKEEKLNEEDIQENINEDTINEDIQIQNGYKYYIQPFDGNIYTFDNIFSNFIKKIPNEQKISFLIEDNLSKYIIGIYPRFILLKDNKGNIKGLTILSFDPFSVLNKSINIHLICSLKNDILSEILIDIIKYCSENLEYDEIRIELFYGNKDGQFYLIKEIEKILIDDVKFKWVNMENDGVYRKIKYQYLNPKNNSLNISSGKFVLQLKTASIISFSLNEEKNEISFINSHNLNDFGIISIFSEMILQKNYKINFDHENNTPFIEFLKTLKFNKFKKITNDFIQNQLGNFEEVKNFIKDNLDSLSYMINDRLLKSSLFGTSLMKIDVSFETIIKTSFNGYSYNIILNNDIEVFSYKENFGGTELFYLVHSTSDNFSFIIHEFQNNKKFENLLETNPLENNNICDIFQNIYSKINQQPQKIMSKIYLPSFKINNSIIYNHPLFLKGIKLYNENEKYYIESFNQIEDFIFGIENSKNNLTNSKIEFDNINEEKDIIVKNEFLIALINPDLLDDLKLPTISVFVVKKEFWEKIEDSESDSF